MRTTLSCRDSSGLPVLASILRVCGCLRCCGRALAMPPTPTTSISMSFAQQCPVVPQPCTPGSDCNASPPFLPCAARSSAYQKLLSLPNLGYIILTTGDSASSGDFGTQPKLADPSWIQIAANRAKVVREYRDLALALYETQRNSGKHFIVSSWETDNAICSDATSCTNATGLFEAFTQWFM